MATRIGLRKNSRTPWNCPTANPSLLEITSCLFTGH